MAKIVFYCHIDKSKLELVEFYKQDIDALKLLNHEVIICTKYIQIPMDFDAIIIWWWTYALYPVLLSKILRKPSIITGTFNFDFPNEFKGRSYFRRPFWQKFLIKYATKLASLNLFVNNKELTSCKRYFNLNNARYYPHIVHDDYINQPLGIREKKLLNISMHTENNLIRKGIPEILHAMRVLKDEGIVVKLNLAGIEGNGTLHLKQMIDELKISEETIYWGNLTRDQKIKLLRSCEIYVQPSHYEGFGLAIAEAMGCCACVIVCDVGGVREVVDNCGLYVKPGSSLDLAQSIKYILNNDELRNELQIKANQRIRKYFTFDQKIIRLKKYLSEVNIM